MGILAEKNNRKFANGVVYLMETQDGYKVEVTDTFLPYYTKDCINENINKLKDYNLGTRNERWMIGVSCMSGCPVGCKFCATGKLKKCRNLTAEEIVAQVDFILSKNPDINPENCKEFKINYTRMGEPFLNIDAVRKAIEIIDARYKTVHHYISTIGIKGSDFSWIKDNITLQLSLHSLNEDRRNDLIPFKQKMTIKELGEIRTKSNLKTTLNMTLVSAEDFDINELKKYFSSEYFFIKLSPINRNDISDKNGLNTGVITAINLA